MFVLQSFAELRLEPLGLEPEVKPALVVGILLLSVLVLPKAAIGLTSKVPTIRPAVIRRRLLSDCNVSDALSRKLAVHS